MSKNPLILPIGGAIALVVAVAATAVYLNHSEWVDPVPAVLPKPVQVTGPGAPTNIAHPRPAPRFELPQPDGKIIKLAELKGNAVLVHFWASWCAPCLGEIPLWLDFAAQWKGKPVKFVAVTLDAAWPQALKILPTEKLPPGAYSVLDTEQTLPGLFGTYQYPETYLLDPDLKIVSKWVGAQEWSGPVIRGAIEAVMAQAN